MELTLKEMAQIAKAKYDAQLQKKIEIANAKDMKAIELRDNLLREIQEVFPYAEARGLSAIGVATIYLPPYKKRSSTSIINAYELFVSDSGMIEVKYLSTHVNGSWCKCMTKQELAEKVLFQYL